MTGYIKTSDTILEDVVVDQPSTCQAVGATPGAATTYGINGIDGTTGRWWDWNWAK